MKLLICLAILLLVLSSCESNQEPSNSEKSEKIGTGTVTPNESPQKELGGFVAALQGTWKRTTYPFGTVEFKGSRVKFPEGEGAAEFPGFQEFKISDGCPYSDEQDKASNYLDFLVLEKSQECNSVKLNGDTLSIRFTATTSGLVYSRMDDRKSGSYTIPENIQGTWANGEDNCAVRNHQRITIDATAIHFFENKADLIEITEYEPTRIFGEFNYKLTDGRVLPYKMSLDAQEKRKTLIRREYGEGAKPGPIRYIRCK